MKYLKENRTNAADYKKWLRNQKSLNNEPEVSVDDDDPINELDEIVNQFAIDNGIDLGNLYIYITYKYNGYDSWKEADDYISANGMWDVVSSLAEPDRLREYLNTLNVEEVKEEIHTVSDFMLFWLSKDDDEIVDFLYQLRSTEALGEVVNIELTIREYPNSPHYHVNTVVYKANKSRADLIELVRNHNTD